MAAIAGVAWFTRGCIGAVGKYWDVPRDVTDDPAHWGTYQPGAEYRLTCRVLYGGDTLSESTTGFGSNIDRLGRDPLEDPNVEGWMAAGTRLRVVKFVRHTGEGERTDVWAQVMDGPLKGRRFLMEMLDPRLLERVNTGESKGNGPSAGPP
jgi:hypothetical protein